MAEPRKPTTDDEQLFAAGKVPTGVCLAYRRHRLTADDYNNLRRFMKESAKNGIDVEPYKAVIARRHGPAAAERVWGQEDAEKAEREKEARHDAQRKGAKPVKEQRTREELRQFLYYINLTDIPGLKKTAAGDTVVTRDGKYWIRHMCYLLTRRGDDPAPFLKRLEAFFSAEDMTKILELAMKGLDRACLVNASRSRFDEEVPPAPAAERDADDEAKYLSNICFNLSYKDVPSLKKAPEESEDKKILSAVSAYWIQDKIRRLIKRNLHVNPFLMKLEAMFSTTLRMVFSSTFCFELLNEYLPSYTKPAEKVHSWLKQSIPAYATAERLANLGSQSAATSSSASANWQVPADPFGTKPTKQLRNWERVDLINSNKASTNKPNIAQSSQGDTAIGLVDSFSNASIGLIVGDSSGKKKKKKRPIGNEQADSTDSSSRDPSTLQVYPRANFPYFENPAAPSPAKILGQHGPERLLPFVKPPKPKPLFQWVTENEPKPQLATQPEDESSEEEEELEQVPYSFIPPAAILGDFGFKCTSFGESGGTDDSSKRKKKNFATAAANEEATLTYRAFEENPVERERYQRIQPVDSAELASENFARRIPDGFGTGTGTFPAAGSAELALENYARRLTDDFDTGTGRTVPAARSAEPIIIEKYVPIYIPVPATSAEPVRVPFPGDAASVRPMTAIRPRPDLTVSSRDDDIYVTNQNASYGRTFSQSVLPEKPAVVSRTAYDDRSPQVLRSDYPERRTSPYPVYPMAFTSMSRDQDMRTIAYTDSSFRTGFEQHSNTWSQGPRFNMEQPPAQAYVRLPEYGLDPLGRPTNASRSPPVTRHHIAPSRPEVSTNKPIPSLLPELNLPSVSSLRTRRRQTGNDVIAAAKSRALTGNDVLGARKKAQGPRPLMEDAQDQNPLINNVQGPRPLVDDAQGPRALMDDTQDGPRPLMNTSSSTMAPPPYHASAIQNAQDSSKYANLGTEYAYGPQGFYRVTSTSAAAAEPPTKVKLGYNTRFSKPI